MPTIDISTKRVAYKFDVNGKYTLMRGDSAVGKTTLCDLIQIANRPNSGVVNKSNAKLLVLNADVEVLNTQNLHDYVIFIDEDAPILKMRGYERWLQQCDSYFVIITRTMRIRNLPISVDSVYTLHSSGKYHTLQLCDTHFENQQLSAVDTIITEDTNSGFEFIKQLLMLVNAEHVIQCTAAEGNSNIIICMKRAVLNGFRHIVVVYDAAAMGVQVDAIKAFIARHTECNFYIIDWQSFEHYILASTVFNTRYTLNDVGCHYESLEQYATMRLGALMPKYHKKHLPPCLRAGFCNKCTERMRCTCVNYEYSKYIYDKVNTLYTVIKAKAYKQISGISGITYEYFKDYAHKLIDTTDICYHIDAVDLQQNLCKLSKDGKQVVINITDLVQRLLNKQLKLLNPSALKNWSGFVK